MESKVRKIIATSLLTKQRMLEDEHLLQQIEKAAHVWVIAFKAGHKLLFCGNGGSAADAQHIAAELSGRFYIDRDPLPAEALHVNTSFLTAVGNDYGFEEVYARMVRALGCEGDVLVALSTSGNSPNILRALDAARQQKMLTIGLTGNTGGKMASRCDLLINVPSTDTPRIQECHILIGHILCEIAEEKLFKSEP
jgi:D-sedoheptulose 7-phosphate isomerase